MIQGLFGRLAPAGAGVVKSFYFTKAVECPIGTRVLNLNRSLRVKFSGELFTCLTLGSEVVRFKGSGGPGCEVLISRPNLRGDTLYLGLTKASC
jgi:hypothetical protein